MVDNDYNKQVNWKFWRKEKKWFMGFEESFVNEMDWFLFVKIVNVITDVASDLIF